MKPGPNDIGFDYHLGLVTNHNDNFKTYVENQRLLWLKPGVTEIPRAPTKSELTRIRYDDEVCSTLTAKAIEFIKQKRDNPFFLYLAHVATHTHITPNAKFRGTSKIGQLGDYLNELDFQVGEVMAVLDELGLANNTILLFSSDNGGALKDHSSAGRNLDLRDESGDVAKRSITAKTDARSKFGHRTNGDLQGGKGSNYEGGFRVPLIVRWPQKIAPATTSNQIITLADMFATSAGLLDVQLPSSAAGDSFDFSPVLLGKKIDGAVRAGAILQTGSGVLAYREGDWKLRFEDVTKWNDDKPTLPKACKLYHLSTDPAEASDVAAQYPEKFKKMRKRLLELLEKGRSR